MNLATRILLLGMLFLLPAPVRAQNQNEKHLETLRSAATVRIVAKQKFPEGATVNLPLKAIAEELLLAAGLKIVIEENAPTDMTVVITATGTTIGTRYYERPSSVTAIPDSTGTVFYFLAHVGGRIVFFTGESEWSGASYSDVFSGDTSPLPPKQISGGPTNPANAPFLDAFWGDGSDVYPTKLLMMIASIYGKEPLRAVLNHSDERIRDCAKWAWLRLYKEDLLITPGMKEGEVIRLLGKPGVTSYKPGKTILKYTYRIVEIEEGMVTSVTFP